MGNPELIAYYGYEGNTFGATLGLFPRERLKGRYSYAFFSDAYRFYKPTVEGMLVQYAKPSWFVELGCDWNGLRKDSPRDVYHTLCGRGTQELFLCRLHRHTPPPRGKRYGRRCCG